MTERNLLTLLFCLLTTVMFGQNTTVSTAEIQETLTSVLFDEHGSHHGHGHHNFSHDNTLVKVEAIDKTLQLHFAFVEEIDDFKYDMLLESVLPFVEEYGLRQLEIYEVMADGTSESVDARFSKKIPIAEHNLIKNDDSPEFIKGEPDFKANPHLGQPNATGSLSGKTIWLSPGHGWLYYSSLGTFSTQRGNTNGMVEDFGSIENVNQYFQQYLMNAGANVWVVRERDMNNQEVIVDNDDGAPTYTETGAWSTSGTPGYNGSTYRFAYSNPTTTATAVYTPNIPKEGWYWISVNYLASANRVVDAQYKVTHAGGETTVSINQEVHSSTWVYLGQFYFDAGTNGKVELLNQSTDTGASQAIIADAMRFGGGVGQLNDCGVSSSAPTNRDRYDESARQYARFQGYPTCESDVVTRPHYAEWELAKGTTTEQNNALYISLHSNAATGTARGTVTYMYNGTTTPNSQLLRNLLQDELIADIHSCWDANWNDRGTNAANFGEVRELTTMPGALVELAFHDNATDANALKSPYFRDLSARAMYKAVVKFFNQTSGSPTTISPIEPDHMTAVNSGNGQITLSWNSPATCITDLDAATGYNVYVSTHGYGFADAIPVTGTSHTLTGLNPNTTYYFQVTATNAGGESFPTATVAARTPAMNTSTMACWEPPLLIVDGFDRLDRSGAVDQNPSGALGTVERSFVDKMNAYDYVVPHARSISNCNVPFDGASNEAVIAGYVNPNDYDAIDWITGEESTVDRTFDATEQGIVQSFLNNGGKIIVSGAEIGWDIGRSTSANAAVSFYNNYLKATYAGDDGGSYNFTGTGIFGGISGSFDDGSNCEYNAEFPDRLSPFGGSSIVLNYSGGTGDGAAIAYNGADFGVVHFGFPLETVTNAGVRDNLICEALTFLEIEDPNIFGCMDATACNYDMLATCDDLSCILPDGCMNPLACNYDIDATCDDLSCILPDGCTNAAACNYDSSATCDDGSCVLPNGCTNSLACNYNVNATCDNGTCILPNGCTNSLACNYDSSATCDDGSCVLPNGCTNVAACNYNASATCDDGSCVLPNGCTNSLACNYDVSATCDDGSCELPDGCTDATACNYNANALCEDSSCTYAPDAGFSGLNGSYCASDNAVTLVPNVTGGVFSGTGVVGSTFNPANVGTLSTPITVQYTVGTTGCSSTSSIQTVVDNCISPGLKLSVRVFLEGALDPATGLMHTKLRQQNLIPIAQPYNVVPWNYTGLESVTTPSNFSASMVDWVLVELRTGTPSLTGSKTTTLVETVAGILLDTGYIVDVTGAPLTFNQLSIGTNYHVLVRHRNHLDIISNGTVTGANNMTYDFTTTNTAFGGMQLKPMGSYYAMYAADYTIDAVIQITDYSYWENEPAILYTYHLADGNLDGTVQATDYDIWVPNMAKIAPIEVVP